VPRFRRDADREELIRIWRRLTVKVVSTIGTNPAPAESMETAINWALPA